MSSDNNNCSLIYRTRAAGIRWSNMASAKLRDITPEVSILDISPRIEPPTVSALKEKRPPLHYHVPRFLPPPPPTRWKLPQPPPPDEDNSRCSTPSSTTSTLSVASDVETPVNSRADMPSCKTVAEGGDGLPLMQVRKSVNMLWLVNDWNAYYVYHPVDSVFINLILIVARLFVHFFLGQKCILAYVGHFVCHVEQIWHFLEAFQFNQMALL